MLPKIMVLCGFLLAFSFSSISGHVLELDDSFLELQKEGMWLVMFYAPWCGHCRTTEPAWMEVGAAMKEKKSNVKVARVDATKYSSVATEFDIRGFPTIKFFKDGRHYDYKGARNKYSIMGFVERAKGPSVTALSETEDFVAARQKHEVLFAYVGKDDESLYEMFVPITKDLFTKINFFTISKKLLPKDISVQREPTLLVFKDGKYYELPADVPDDEFLRLWVETEQFVAYNQLTGMSYHLLSSAGRRFAIAVLSPKDKFNETFYKMSLERKHHYMFCWVLGNSIANSMTRSDISVPNVLVYDTQSHEYFVMIEEEQSPKLTKKNVEDFFDKINQGLIPPKGGNGIYEQSQKIIVDMVKFIVNLFKTRPVVASLIVILPSVLVSTLCVCLCQMKDEDVVYKMGTHTTAGAKTVELDSEVKVSKKKDSNKEAQIEESEPDVGTAEGLRKRVTETAGKE